MKEIPLNARAAAAVFMESCGNDVEQAKRVARLELDEPRYAELRTLLCYSAIDNEIDQLWRSGRAVRKREVDSSPLVSRFRPPPIQSTPPRALAKGETSTVNAPLQQALDRRVAGLLHFEMPNGTYLSDWTKRTLIDHARKILAASQSAERTARWLMSLAELLPKEDSVVGQVLVEADLQRLWRRQQQLAG